MVSKMLLSSDKTLSTRIVFELDDRTLLKPAIEYDPQAYIIVRMNRAIPSKLKSHAIACNLNLSEREVTAIFAMAETRIFFPPTARTLRWTGFHTCYRQTTERGWRS